MRDKKKTLAGGILHIIVILIIAGLIMVVTGLSMLYGYQRQMSGLQFKIAEEYMLKINQGFAILNMDIRDMLYNSEEIRRVAQAYEAMGRDGGPQEQYRAAMHQSNCVMTLKNTFLNMGKIHGTYYNFFYYDKKHDVMTEYGSADYQTRRDFTEYIKSLCDSGTLRCTRDSKWFLEDGKVCTIYQSDAGVMGAWATEKDFVEAVFKLAPEQCSGIELYVPEWGEAKRFDKGNKGLITGKLVPESDENYYVMGNAEFQCRFILDTSGYENMILYPLLFLILIVIYLVFVSMVLLYTKRNILSQVSHFYNNLLQFKDAARFHENTGLIEFAEAGKILNKLSEEINRLKIDIYEEQLARQQTELDYMQLQIRPHFYLNCMNIIYSMAQVGRTKEIQEIALQVSKYLRYIFKKGMDAVVIEKELEFTANYLKVVECMYAESYPCHVHVQEHLLEFCIPPLLIQTFVENSLKHNLDLGERFNVEIRIDEQCAADGKVCRIMISDNGSGFPKKFIEEMDRGALCEKDSEYHIGIRNAAARMKLFYGETARIGFSNGPQGGAVVTVLIPMG